MAIYPGIGPDVSRRHCRLLTVNINRIRPVKLFIVPNTGLQEKMPHFPEPGGGDYKVDIMLFRWNLLNFGGKPAHTSFSRTRAVYMVLGQNAAFFFMKKPRYICVFMYDIYP